MGNLDFSDLRINANRISRIFAKHPECISDKELDRIDVLKKKDITTHLTEKESNRLEELENKRDESGYHIVNKPTQNYLWFIYLKRKYGNYPRILTGHEGNPYAPNGTLKEPYSIGLIEKVSGIKLFRNKVRQKNDYVHGIIDAFDQPICSESNMVHEIKTTSDRIKFNFKRRYPLEKTNYLQLQGYLSISGNDSGIIHHCLVDYPASVILEQKSLHRNRFINSGGSFAEFDEYWDKYEPLFRHENVPDKDRVFSCPVDRDEEAIDKIYKKVVDCRTWLTELVEFMENTKNINIVEQNKIRF